MESKSITKDTITIAFSPDEITFLANAINETLEAVEDFEFQTRTGGTRTRALAMHAALREMLEEAKRV